MKVVYLFRKPNHTHWSIEHVFRTLSKAIGERADVLSEESPYFSTGLLNRCKAIRWTRDVARREKADLYHVTGDVHFLTLGLRRSKTILTIHDLSFLRQGSLIHRFILWIFWVFLPVRRSRYVTCVSEE